jgi:hypothetical protein
MLDDSRKGGDGAEREAWENTPRFAQGVTGGQRRLGKDITDSLIGREKASKKCRHMNENVKRWHRPPAAVAGSCGI